MRFYALKIQVKVLGGVQGNFREFTQMMLPANHSSQRVTPEPASGSQREPLYLAGLLSPHLRQAAPLSVLNRLVFPDRFSKPGMIGEAQHGQSLFL